MCVQSNYIRSRNLLLDRFCSFHPSSILSLTTLFITNVKTVFVTSLVTFTKPLNI